MLSPSGRRLALLVASLSAVALAFAYRPAPASSAEPPVHTVYVSITGDGPTAKAWYAGAPPVGVAVQDALTTLSNQGYRVKSLVSGERPVVVVQGGSTSSAVLERTYVLLMEK